ncbi:hypothetical protein BJV78DRAFT_764961 [Lactifluus subvellereus]|nr:hypothetical protein BJV78DRAFT_764961 [Lactifluus subvellereus]
MSPRKLMCEGHPFRTKAKLPLLEVASRLLSRWSHFTQLITLALRSRASSSGSDRAITGSITVRSLMWTALPRMRPTCPVHGQRQVLTQVIWISTMFGKRLSNVHMSVLGRPLQWSPVSVVPGIRIYIVLGNDPSIFLVTLAVMGSSHYFPGHSHLRRSLVEVA